MKPAPSIIGFTAASGLGYGMLFVLAIGAVIGVIPTDRWLGAVGFVLTLAAITGGLLASTLHLGHPERAWRAITQWRSSWLSREGLFALLTYLPALYFAVGWILGESVSGLVGLIAVAAATGAAITVYCTGMIYASLPPIKAWHQPLTAPVYLALSMMTGLLAVQCLMTAFGLASLAIGITTMIAIVGACVLKILYWQRAARERADGPTAETATGLGSFGLERMLDPPHTQTNYLLDEMGFQIGRKHARILRALTLMFGFFLPLILTLIALTLTVPLPTILLTAIAFVTGMIGVLLERWLFFAEAEHSVMLYYGGVPAGSTRSRAPELEQASSDAPSRPRRSETLRPNLNSEFWTKGEHLP